MFVDMHCDTIPAMYDRKNAGQVTSLAQNDLHIDLCKGETLDKWCQFFAVWIPDELRGNDSVEYFEKVSDTSYVIDGNAEIDDFFDLYGYAYNGIAVPNINSRPEWNYVKTVGMVGEGSLPSDDSKLIDGYFNNGIRFWNWGDHIGNYSLNNRPT